MLFTTSVRTASALLFSSTACLMGVCHAAPSPQIAAAKASAPVSAPSPGSASKKKSVKKKSVEYYQLVANYDGVQMDVRINDMPVPLSKRGEGFTVTIINNLLTGASNTLTVTVKPPHNKAAPPPNASMHVDITAYSNKDKGNKDKGRVLYTYDWKRKNSHTPLPHIQKQFRTAPLSEPLSWQNAATLKMATLDKAGINAQIKRLYEALEAKNAAETTALLASEVHDQEVGFGLPRGDPDGEQRKYYEELFRQPNWGLTPVHYKALQYDIYGGGRVVRAHAPNGQPTFLSTPGKDGGTTVFDVYLSFIKGHWVIVR